MVGIALKTEPHAVCLVPEKRTERTTEGGLDAVGQRSQLAPCRRTSSSMPASGFRCLSGQTPAQIEMAAELRRAGRSKFTRAPGATRLPKVEREAAEAEWQLIRDGAQARRKLGLEVHAGHGLDYATAETIASLPQVVELNIGHFLIGEAVFEGLAETVKFMRAAMDRGRKKAQRA